MFHSLGAHLKKIVFVRVITVNLFTHCTLRKHMFDISSSFSKMLKSTEEKKLHGNSEFMGFFHTQLGMFCRVCHQN